MTSKNASIKIGGYSEGHLLIQAKKVVDKKAAETPIFSQEAEDRIPKFDTDELFLGKLLGKGGFCAVSEVIKVALKEGVAAEKSALVHSNNFHEHQANDILQDRDFMQTHFLRKGKEYRYAIKKLRDDAIDDVQSFINGIVDLALEARFLAVIRHPNIIKMRALSSGTPYSRDFFVVLDRLYDILTRTLVSWKKRRGGGLQKVMDRGGKKASAFWAERMIVAHDLACALRYLHSHNIIYRDLKPDNIGFDVRGDVKIFDFGLSRQLPNCADGNASPGATYKMTGDTGSPRYMAPEIALELPYNEGCDVYSFGILLHQMCSLEIPFEGYSMNQFEKKVVRGGFRPKMDLKWPERIQKLIGRCWSETLSDRPGMNEIVDLLHAEVAEHSDQSTFEMLDASGKTQHSIHAYQRSKGK